MTEKKKDENFIQTTLNDEQTRAMKIFLINKGENNQRQWLRDLILKEIDYKEENK